MPSPLALDQSQESALAPENQFAGEPGEVPPVRFQVQPLPQSEVPLGPEEKFASVATSIARRLPEYLPELATRAMTESERLRHTGEFDPGPSVEAAELVLGGVRVPAGALGASLGSKLKVVTPEVLSEALPSQHPARTIMGSEPRVSTRLPTSKTELESPMSVPRLQVGIGAMDDEVRAKAVTTLRASAADYPNLRPGDMVGAPDSVLENLIQHETANLLWLYNHPSVLPWRDRAMLWYDGGNHYVTGLAQRYGYHPNSSAAATANLSPKKDWFENVSLSDRLHFIDSGMREVATTTPMLQHVERKIAEGGQAAKYWLDPKQQNLLANIYNKQYGELTDGMERAFWVRLYDETYHTRDHRIITPEGNVLGPVLTKQGVLAGTAWAGNEAIRKALLSLDAGGDVARLTNLLGQRHKVRSFYNCLICPNSLEGDVVVDTHAVGAALLQSVGLESEVVLQSFGPAPSSRLTGSMGLYPVHAEAYRRAAVQAGILPRQMQSITWEAIRGMFPAELKTAEHAENIKAIWLRYRNGLISQQQAQEEILGVAGGIRPPSWFQQ